MFDISFKKHQSYLLPHLLSEMPKRYPMSVKPSARITKLPIHQAKHIAIPLCLAIIEHFGLGSGKLD
jgi:hypothetical protein